MNAVKADTIRMTPPLTVSDQEIEQAIAILTAVLAEEILL
jgi:4-aminobutyrate aminotransferase-like enzyme